MTLNTAAFLSAHRAYDSVVYPNLPDGSYIALVPILTYIIDTHQTADVAQEMLDKLTAGKIKALADFMAKAGK
jgi:hypothetical protein